MHALCDDLREQTERALWELGNVIDCLNDELWDAVYCGAPAWKHAYHTLHSLDQWYINPNEYVQPIFHVDGLNDLDRETPPEQRLTHGQLRAYLAEISAKLRAYLDGLTDEALAECPTGCERTRMSLIVAQMRHLHSHMGMLMGFIIDDTGKWPTVLGGTRPFPQGEYSRYC